MKEKTNQYDSQGNCHGLWKDYWPNGTLWSRGHYLHGKEHGLWESYWANGAFRWRGHYLHGKPHGIWERYRQDSTLSHKIYHLLIR